MMADDTDCPLWLMLKRRLVGVGSNPARAPAGVNVPRTKMSRKLALRWTMLPEVQREELEQMGQIHRLRKVMIKPCVAGLRAEGD